MIDEKRKANFHINDNAINPSLAEPGYALHLQTG